MTAADFISSLSYPVVRFASLGEPAGCDVAVLDDTRLPFDSSDLVGTVEDGVWHWNGEGEPRDFGRNTVQSIWIRNDAREWSRQNDDYEASMR